MATVFSSFKLKDVKYIRTKIKHISKAHDDDVIICFLNFGRFK